MQVISALPTCFRWVLDLDADVGTVPPWSGEVSERVSVSDRALLVTAATPIHGDQDTRPSTTTARSGAQGSDSTVFMGDLSALFALPGVPGAAQG
jgi:hypothetical protein